MTTQGSVYGAAKACTMKRSQIPDAIEVQAGATPVHTQAAKRRIQMIQRQLLSKQAGPESHL